MINIEMVSSICSLFDLGIERCEILVPLEEDETEKSGEGESEKSEKSEKEEKSEKSEKEYLAVSLRANDHSQTTINRIHLAASLSAHCVCLDIIVPPPEYIS
jgi:hypothetical protein